jgi:hypothetical protein
MHVLYLLQSRVSPRPIVTLLEYFIDSGRARSLSWQRETARAVGLLVDFLTANAARLRGEDNPKVFAKFAEALVGGTLDLNGNDPSELFWEPKTVSRARNLLRAVTAFSDWLENRHGTCRINPWRDASISEQIALGRRLDKRNANSLLGYASYRSDNQARAKISRAVIIQRKATSAFAREVKFFPTDLGSAVPRFWRTQQAALASARTVQHQGHLDHHPSARRRLAGIRTLSSLHVGCRDRSAEPEERGGASLSP